MRSTSLLAALIWSLAFSAMSEAEDNVQPAVDAVQAAFDRFVQAETNKARIAARKELVSLGPVVVPKLTEAALDHSEWRVRRACYEVLTRSFSDDERTSDTLLRHGLLDQDSLIRSQSAFDLGELKVQRARPALRAAFEAAKGKDDKFIRFTLAKSLAQLGDADVLRTLFDAVSDDEFISRWLGNIGLKALTGKNLADFAGYSCSEGAVISGGKEPLLPSDALTLAERKAGRFRAAVAYFKWLKEEQPELYIFVADRSNPRNDSGRP